MMHSSYRIALLAGCLLLVLACMRPQLEGAPVQDVFGFELKSHELEQASHITQGVPIESLAPKYQDLFYLTAVMNEFRTADYIAVTMDGNSEYVFVDKRNGALGTFVVRSRLTEKQMKRLQKAVEASNFRVLSHSYHTNVADGIARGIIARCNGTLKRIWMSNYFPAELTPLFLAEREVFGDLQSLRNGSHVEPSAKSDRWDVDEALEAANPGRNTRPQVRP